jgi:hypothetical protein
MILRGPSTSKSEDSMFPEDLALLRKFDQKGLEITGYPWAGDTFFVYANRGRGGAPPPPNATGNPLFGHGPEFGYLYYGAVWYGNEIWNGGRLREADADGNGVTEDLELLQWLDKHRPGKNDFQPWTKATHPTLGAVEVGGWNPKFWSQNPPPEMLETWARNEALFNLYLAQQLPQVRIVSAAAKPGGDGTFEITMTVANEGGMPTALEIAKRVKMVREDAVTLQLAPGQTIVRGADPGPGGGGRGRGRGEGPGARGGGPGGAGDGPPRISQNIGWLRAGEQRTVTWTVRGTGQVTIGIASTRGGVDTRTVTAR